MYSDESMSCHVSCHWVFNDGHKNPVLLFLFIDFHCWHSVGSPLLILSSNVCESSACSDGCPVAGITGLWDGPSWNWLVGHWHGCLDWTLPEESPVWRSVLASNGGHCGTAERQRQGPATCCAQCPSNPMTLLEESGHRERRWTPVGWVFPNRQSLQRLAGLHSANIQGWDLNRLAWQLLVG